MIKDKNKKLRNQLREWYSEPSTKFEIIKSLKNRELGMLRAKDSPQEGNIRGLRCYNVQSMDYLILRITRGFNWFYNFYMSVAQYQYGVPRRTPDFKRNENKEFWQNHWKHINQYDYFIDVDSKSHSQKDMDKSKNATLDVIHVLDRYNIPHTITFSGMGFHITIPQKVFIGYDHNKIFKPHQEYNLYRKYAQITEKLHKHISPLIDKNVYDSRRLQKIPYTLSVYKNKCLVCLPINDKSFLKAFDIAYANPEIWIRKIKGRGIKTFNNGKTINPLLNYVEL